MLAEYQRSFLEVLIRRGALQFGDFTLKSGRKSPYFINTGCFDSGGDLSMLGQTYAAVIRERFDDDIGCIFGPAYKGIPLALACASAYERAVGRPVGWAFDRKEVKDHGDRGAFVGRPLAEGLRVVLVDDVLTAGTALRASLAKLAERRVDVVGALVAVDREEPGPGGAPATEEIEREFGVRVEAILGIGEAVDHLEDHAIDGVGVLDPADAARIREHLAGGAGA